MEKRKVTIRARVQNSVKSDTHFKRGGGLLPSCVTGVESRRNKDGFSPVKPPVSASDSIKGQMPLKCSYRVCVCVCVCVLKEQGKQYI